MLAGTVNYVGVYTLVTEIYAEVLLLTATTSNLLFLTSEFVTFVICVAVNK